MPKKDITNQRFGKLLVLEDSDQRAGNGSILWKCQCDCGNIVLSTGSDLKGGRRVTCGKCSRYENLLGQTFHKLTVIADAQKKINNKEVWICRCECGNITEVHSANLKNGSVKSCGCLQGDINLQDRRFGKLKVLSRVINSENRHVLHQWICKCDCGNTIVYATNRLLSGQVNSCGCLIPSVGELKIAQFLLEQKIPFETQKTFSTAKYPNTNRPMKFDFYLPQLNLLIEYDGLQHFQAVDYFGGEEHFQLQQQRDNDKNEWCKANNFTLLRIPYNTNDNELITILTRCTEV